MSKTVIGNDPGLEGAQEAIAAFRAAQANGGEQPAPEPAPKPEPAPAPKRRTTGK